MKLSVREIHEKYGECISSLDAKLQHVDFAPFRTQKFILVRDGRKRRVEAYYDSEEFAATLKKHVRRRNKKC